MPADAKTLLDEALQLPAAARAELATKLIESLDAELDDSAEELWQAEIERRLKEIDAGTAKTLPWEEVRRQLLAHNRDNLDLREKLAAADLAVADGRTLSVEDVCAQTAEWRRR